MKNIADVIGAQPQSETKSKAQKSQTWMAGKSTGVGEKPDTAYYRALAKVSDAEAELNKGDNRAFTRKARPVQEAIIVGLGDEQFFLATPEMLTPAARKELGIKADS